MKRLLLIFGAWLMLIFMISASPSESDTARIHVIANSDSKEDIAVKVEISEALKELLRDESFDDMESIEEGLKARSDKIVEKCDEILEARGKDYRASAEVGIRHFDRKTLGNSAFPEGDYLALTVTLGEGEGHNWWSVIFPEISLGASLAMGEEGSVGRTVIMGDGSIVKIRCLLLELGKIILTKK